MDSQLQVKQKNTHLVAIKQSYLRPSVSLLECSDEEVKKPIRYAMALVGLPAHKAPSDIEKAIHLKWIRENYPDFTPEEIKYAFEKAMARKFGPEVNVSCYENFSCEYIGRILSAYTAWDGSEPGSYETFPNEDQTRNEIMLAFKRLIEDGHIQHFPYRFYSQMIRDKLIEGINRPSGRRVYPKQIAILKGFVKYAEFGYKNLYTQVKVDDVTKKNERLK
jgi:hypothetical protein